MRPGTEELRPRAIPKPPPPRVSEARTITNDAKQGLFKFRTECLTRINELQQELEHWQHELHILDEFLRGDILEMDDELPLDM